MEITDTFTKNIFQDITGNGPVVVLIVGMPLSGKSTLVSHLIRLGIPKETRVLSADTIRQTILESEKTGCYFDPELESMVWDMFYAGLKRIIELKPAIIIIDNTNLTKGGRGNIIRLIPSVYSIRFIILPEYRTEIDERNRATKKQIIPESEMDDMWRKFEYPSAWEVYQNKGG